MKNIDGNNIEFSLSKDIIKENFPVVAGSKIIVNSIIGYDKKEAYFS